MEDKKMQNYINNANTVSSKEQQRKEIAKHIEEYLKANNTITVCEPAPNKIVRLKDIPTKH